MTVEVTIHAMNGDTIAERSDDVTSYSVLVRSIEDGQPHDVLYDEDFNNFDAAQAMAECQCLKHGLGEHDYEEVGG